MRRLLRQAIPLICLGCGAGTRSVSTESSAVRATHNPLVGTWESASLAYDMMGTTLIFAPDGTFATVIGVMLRGTYRTSGNTLTITLSGPGQPTVESAALQFSDGGVEVRADGRTRHLVPLARVNGNSLVGQWVGTQENGVISYEEYTSGGHVRVRIPSHVGRGRYELTGDTTLTLQMVSPRSAAHPGVVRIDGDTLRTGPTSSDVYLRARPLIPANIQQPKVSIR